MELDELIKCLTDAQKAQQLLYDLLSECGKYGYEIEGMSRETLNKVQRFMKFDDSE